MEVEVARGQWSADMVLQVRIGDVKRQAPLQTDTKILFPQVPVAAQNMKVDIFQRVGTYKLMIDPTKGVSEVSVAGDGALSLGLRVRPQKQADNNAGMPRKKLDDAMAQDTYIDQHDLHSFAGTTPIATQQVAHADPKESEAAVFAELRRKAADYIEQYDLRQVLQDMFQKVIRERPDDPFAFMRSYLAKTDGAGQDLQQRVRQLETEVAAAKEERDRLESELNGIRRDGEGKDAAATKIQAVARGKQGREEVQQKKLHEEERRQRTAAEEERDRLAAELETLRKQVEDKDAAAVKIQAVARGKQGREEVQQKKQGEEEMKRRLAAEEERDQLRAELEAMRKQAEDKELAATKIQAVARGKQGREEVQQKKQGDEEYKRRVAAEEERDRLKEELEAVRKQAEDKELAATKIQAVARGKQGREEVQQKKQGEDEYKRRLAAEEERDRLKTEFETFRKQVEDKELAATKIQAVARGKQGRDEVQQKKQGEEEAKMRLAAEEERDRLKTELETLRKQVEDKELAATKIQAVARGKQGREEVQQKKQGEEEAKRRMAVEEERDNLQAERDRLRAELEALRKQAEDRDAAAAAKEQEKEAAATRIQAVARGKQGREEVQGKRLHEEEKKMRLTVEEERDALREELRVAKQQAEEERKKRQQELEQEVQKAHKDAEAQILAFRRSEAVKLEEEHRLRLAAEDALHNLQRQKLDEAARLHAEELSQSVHGLTDRLELEALQHRVLELEAKVEEEKQNTKVVQQKLALELAEAQDLHHKVKDLEATVATVKGELAQAHAEVSKVSAAAAEHKEKASRLEAELASSSRYPSKARNGDRNMVIEPDGDRVWAPDIGPGQGPTPRAPVQPKEHKAVPPPTFRRLPATLRPRTATPEPGGAGYPRDAGSQEHEEGADPGVLQPPLLVPGGAGGQPQHLDTSSAAIAARRGDPVRP